MHLCSTSYGQTMLLHNSKETNAEGYFMYSNCVCVHVGMSIAPKHPESDPRESGIHAARTHAREGKGKEGHQSSDEHGNTEPRIGSLILQFGQLSLGNLPPPIFSSRVSSLLGPCYSRIPQYALDASLTPSLYLLAKLECSQSLSGKKPELKQFRDHRNTS